MDNAISMRAVEREAEVEIVRRFRELGVDRKPRPARLGAGLDERHRGKVDEFLAGWPGHGARGEGE